MLLGTVVNDAAERIVFGTPLLVGTVLQSGSCYASCYASLCFILSLTIFLPPTTRKASRKHHSVRPSELEALNQGGRHPDNSTICIQPNSSRLRETLEA